jgi:hypothetical protein
MRDVPPIVERYHAAPHPDLPEDLRFLSPNRQRKAWEGYNIVRQAPLVHSEDLLVEYLVFMIVPWYADRRTVHKVLTELRMLHNRYNTKRRSPTNSRELDLLKDYYTFMLLDAVSGRVSLMWKMLRSILQYSKSRNVGLPEDYKDRLAYLVYWEITPFCTTQDYKLDPEVRDELDRELYCNNGGRRQPSDVDPPVQQFEALHV